jgi:hypothetical protein
MATQWAGHRLFQERDRQHRDQQRRHEEDGVGLGQGQRLHAPGKGREHHDAQRAAHRLQAPAHLEQAATLAQPGHPHQHQRQGGETAQGGHLHGAVVRHEQLHDHVHQREKADGQQHRKDAAQLARSCHGCRKGHVERARIVHAPSGGQLLVRVDGAARWPLPATS